MELVRLRRSSRREEGKANRRGRVISAARALLRESGLEGLAMKTVAVRADVGLSTIYNLFDSQQAILVGVFEQELAALEVGVAAAKSADALARIFDAVDILADQYETDQEYYRTLMRGRTEFARMLQQSPEHLDPRLAFWPDLVQQVAYEQWITKTADVSVLQEN